MPSDPAASDGEAAEGPCDRMLIIEEVSTRFEPQLPHPDLKEFYRSIFDSGEHSDLKILLRDDRLLLVRKAIVCANCGSLKQAVGQMETAEDSDKFQAYYVAESAEGALKMVNDPPDSIKALLEYLYTRDYRHDSNNNDQLALFFHFEVYAVATKWRVDGLKHLAQIRFRHAFLSGHCESSILYCLVPMMYDSLPESEQELKGIVANYVATHIAVLLPDSRFAETLAGDEQFRTHVAIALSTTQGQILNQSCSWRPVDS